MNNQVKPEHKINGSIRKHFQFGALTAAALLLGIGGWAVFTEINGAVVAQGNIVVETNSKQVQHQEGGILSEIMVKDGDSVEAGDVVARLDSTVTQANIAILNQQLAEQNALHARLIAERDTAEHPDFTLASMIELPEQEMDAVLQGELQLMSARRKSLGGQKKQLDEQVRQFEQQIIGLEAQHSAVQSELDIVDDELQELKDLYSKKLVRKTRVTELKRDQSELQGKRGELIASIAKARQSISERKLQKLQLHDDFLASVLELLQQTRSEIVKLEEQMVTAKDELARVQIRAPRTGTVHRMAVHTIGGVIAPGDTLMLIVPNEDKLVAEVQIRPVDRDQLSIGQQATMRLTSFDQKTTPELKGQLVTISPDLTKDETTGISYYTGRFAIPESELAKLGNKKLVPGMPVDTFAQTQRRSVISYIVKPLRDQIALSMRER
ncbi:HlyD family type I secretion periplasmic adaptor subunit [Flexibacterium corallicola]|uniref:HlyD family type I secretion periplasmic adaptor subunit n=1 Tax=Flexibacterium corallicola TaxID=3037259 RepID=UPI00286EFA02|nr:HlyD family type I secretion periplasmic adaptor subunit [Pseudovibrio sp. M1P-2-3]